MITCRQIANERNYCSNCDREMPLVLIYQLSSGGMVNNGFTLCEDCSCALSNLHFKVMEDGKPHKYDQDEITEDTP